MRRIGRRASTNRGDGGRCFHRHVGDGFARRGARRATGSSTYVPVSPYRILDAREGLGFPRKVNAGEAFTLPLVNVPPGATAVVLNVTITGPADGGFVTVYPTGVGRPNASSINVDTAGQTIANLVTVPIGTGGAVDVFAQPMTDLVADVQGYYVPAASAQAGRFVPVTPTRLLDSRGTCLTQVRRVRRR